MSPCGHFIHLLWPNVLPDLFYSRKSHSGADQFLLSDVTYLLLLLALRLLTCCIYRPYRAQTHTDKGEVISLCLPAFLHPPPSQSALCPSSFPPSILSVSFSSLLFLTHHATDAAVILKHSSIHLSIHASIYPMIPLDSCISSKKEERQHSPCFSIMQAVSVSVCWFSSMKPSRQIASCLLPLFSRVCVSVRVCGRGRISSSRQHQQLAAALAPDWGGGGNEGRGEEGGSCSIRQSVARKGERWLVHLSVSQLMVWAFDALSLSHLIPLVST